MTLQVNGSVKKLLKGGRDLEDSLLAAVIRDLKIVEVRNSFLNMFPYAALCIWKSPSCVVVFKMGGVISYCILFFSFIGTPFYILLNLKRKKRLNCGTKVLSSQHNTEMQRCFVLCDPSIFWMSRSDASNGFHIYRTDPRF